MKIPMLLYFIILKHHFIIILYHFTILSASQNSIFINILFFNLSLLFLSNHFSISFSQAFQQPFLFLSLSTSNTGSTHNTHTPMIHRSTYPNSSPHPHPHTQTQTSNQQQSHTHKHKPSIEPHTQTIKPVGANNGHHIHHPSHRSETHTADLKPRPPIKKIITEASPFKPIQKKSLPEQIHSNPFKKHYHRSHWSKPIQKKKIIIGANPFKKKSSLEQTN